MPIDLFDREFFPAVRPSGLNLYRIDQLRSVSRDKYTLAATGEEFDLLHQLKASCNFGVGGVLATYSNSFVYRTVQLSIGRISRLEPPVMANGREVKVIAAPKFAAIIGNVELNECVFPYFQHTDSNAFNITCSAFAECPDHFQPAFGGTYYLSFKTSDPAIELLHDSLWHLSQNDPEKAAIFLFTSVEVATTKITGISEFKRLSSKLSDYVNSEADLAEDDRKCLKRIKKNIERHLVPARGKVAHQGKRLKQNDLLSSYAALVDLYANYARLTRYTSLAQ